MNNKLCVITGANSGIGFETARALAQQGAFIVMVCRNEDKADAARIKILKEVPDAGIDVVLCDFSIQAEIRNAAKEIQQKYEKIDILINNHGFVAAERENTVDGLEITFAVNHIGYFLFTHLLLNMVKESEEGRIISVASEAHHSGEFNSKNLQLDHGFKPWKAYGNSKLFNILFTKELANRLAETSVTANCLHPGVVSTNFAQDSNWVLKTLFRLGKYFFISPQKGAQTTLFLATSDTVKDVNGAYFKNKKVAIPSKTARDEEAASVLWDMSEKLCGIGSP